MHYVELEGAELEKDARGDVVVDGKGQVSVRLTLTPSGFHRTFQFTADRIRQNKNPQGGVLVEWGAVKRLNRWLLQRQLGTVKLKGES